MPLSQIVDRSQNLEFVEKWRPYLKRSLVLVSQSVVRFKLIDIGICSMLVAKKRKFKVFPETCANSTEDTYGAFNGF